MTALLGHFLNEIYTHVSWQYRRNKKAMHLCRASERNNEYKIGNVTVTKNVILLNEQTGQLNVTISLDIKV